MKLNSRNTLDLINQEIIEDLLNNFNSFEQRLKKLNIDVDFDPNYKILHFYHPLAYAIYFIDSAECDISSRNAVNNNSVFSWKRVLGFEHFFQLFCNAILVDEKNAEIKDEYYYKDSNLEFAQKMPIVEHLDNEIMRFFANNPKFLFELSSRKFEELIEKILKDSGFKTKLTLATRDGGKDILAWMSNDITELLTYVECKKYSPTNPVGVSIVREVYGVQKIYRVNKSIIITTSRYTRDAKMEAELISSEIDLKDYNDIVSWLKKYL